MVEKLHQLKILIQNSNFKRIRIAVNENVAFVLSLRALNACRESYYILSYTTFRAI